LDGGGRGRKDRQKGKDIDTGKEGGTEAEIEEVLQGQIKGEMKKEREMHRESDKGGEDRPIARGI
jgi:hypothetical protein